ncbi:MAG: dihydrodipicolinate synthase family protein [Opitutales bacterium]|nr:dihydrodipicolinate synthase family protein [Opitutales bacterium]
MNSEPHHHSGVVVPMITPFTRDGDIDEPAVERIARRLAAHNIGVFVLGTTGETASIPRTDRFRLVTTVLRAVDDRVHVYAGIGDNCFTNAVKAAERYLDAGVTAVVSHLPSYYPLTPDEMQLYFERLHDHVKGPLILYNIPATTGMSLPLTVVEYLSELPRIVGFKDSERVDGRMEDAARRFAEREDFALFMGTSVLSVDALKLGYSGLVPNSGNLVPALWEKLYNHARNGEWNEAFGLQTLLNEVAWVFQGNRTLGQSLAALKVLLAEQSLCEPYVLPPLRTIPEKEREGICVELLACNLR